MRALVPSAVVVAALGIASGGAWAGGHVHGGGGHHGGGHHVSVHGYGGGGHGWHHGGHGYVGDDDCGACDARSSIAWWWEVGMSLRWFRGPAVASSGTIDDKTQSYDYSLSSGVGRPRDSVAAALDLRFLFATGRNLYVGGAFEGGSLTRSPIALTAASDSTVSFSLAPTTMLGLAGVAGVRARAGWAELDGEVVAGARAYTTTAHSFEHGIDVGTATLDTTWAPRLEARVHGLVWLAPTWVLGAAIGVDALDRGSVSFAIVAGSASRPYAEPP